MSRRLASCACVLLGLALLPLMARAPQAKSYALLVGVADYEHAAFSKLRYTENDVEALAKILDRPGSPFYGNVRVMTCTRGDKDAKDRPTAANVRAAVAALVKDRKRGDTVLVALSGHGMELSVPDPAGKGKDKSVPFFCPADAQLEGTDYATGKNPRLVGVKELMAELEDCGAGGKLVLMDACRNEYKAPAVARALGARKGLVPEGVAAMFSCRSGQVSFETEGLRHGVFFHFVLEGLSGKARNEDGEVTWRDLTGYVVRNVKKNAGKLVGGGADQTPVTVEVEVDNAFLLRPAGAGVIAKRWPKEVTNSIGMKLVRIPKGTFRMGSPNDEAHREADEGPEHDVEITKEFHLGVCEVTVGQFRSFVKDAGYKTEAERKDGALRWTHGGWKKDPQTNWKAPGFGQADDHPVTCVSWNDAWAFCEWLSKKEGGHLYRLPSEAEWEYACRGGGRPTKTPFSFGNTLPSDRANHHGGAAKGGYLGRTCATGSYKANRYGLYDMHGNVWEWCSDWYGANYYAGSPKADPAGPPEGSYRVIRGGSWRSSDARCRSARRRWHTPSYRISSLGFRVALVPSRK